MASSCLPPPSSRSGVSSLETFDPSLHRSMTSCIARFQMSISMALLLHPCASGLPKKSTRIRPNLAVLLILIGLYARSSRKRNSSGSKLPLLDLPTSQMMLCLALCPPAATHLALRAMLAIQTQDPMMQSPQIVAASATVAVAVLKRTSRNASCTTPLCLCLAAALRKL